MCVTVYYFLYHTNFHVTAKDPTASVTVSELTGEDSLLSRTEEGIYNLSVSYGHELGVVCETQSIFRVDWIFEDDNTSGLTKIIYYSRTFYALLLLFCTICS